jgi:hypothetical protein
MYIIDGEGGRSPPEARRGAAPATEPHPRLLSKAASSDSANSPIEAAPQALAALRQGGEMTPGRSPLWDRGLSKNRPLRDELLACERGPRRAFGFHWQYGSSLTGPGRFVECDCTDCVGVLR